MEDLDMRCKSFCIWNKESQPYLAVSRKMSASFGRWEFCEIGAEARSGAGSSGLSENPDQLTQPRHKYHPLSSIVFHFTAASCACRLFSGKGRLYMLYFVKLILMNIVKNCFTILSQDNRNCTAWMEITGNTAFEFHWFTFQELSFKFKYGV